MKRLAIESDPDARASPLAASPVPQPGHRAFLSHNSADKAAVAELARRLEAAGISCWLDQWNLIPGDPWDLALEDALGSCAVCCVFFGPSGLGPWHHEEMRLAIRRRVTDPLHRLRVLPVILPGGQRTAESQLPPFLQGHTWVLFQQTLDDADAFHRLKCGILGQPPGYGPGGAPFPGRCPYVGLKTFRQSDARLFFGRDALLQQVLTRLADGFGTPRERRFLALIGASGSGKSSLAAAGLLPAVFEWGALPDSTHWLCVQCRPGANPWESLWVALGNHPQLAPHLAALNALVITPAQEGLRLHLLARLALHDRPDTHRLILFLDQFEEFFALEPPKQDPDGQRALSRQRFLDNLLYPATVPGSRVLVVLTMRADFFGHCAAHAGLREAVSENQCLIGPMTPTELRESIEGPALLCGCEVEPALVDRLLDDMEHQPGALPFLQHTLFKLWEARDGRRLTAAAYRIMGSLEGALDAHSEAFYGSLSEDRQRLLRTILLDLIQLGEGAADTKRRRPLSQLAYGDVNTIHPFIAELASAHLVVTDQGAGQVQVEVAHETLITGWKRLHGWIDECRDEKRQKDRIEIAASEWDAAELGQRPDFLWRGAQLDSADYALGRSSLSLNEQATRFLYACREERALEAARQQSALEREHENQRLLQEAETARALAEARAERERSQQIERQHQEEIAAAQELVGRAQELWRDFGATGNQHTDDWRLMRLAEIEGLLVDALTHDRTATGAGPLLAGVRRLLVETGIKTQDLNFASIYLQRLKDSADPGSTGAPDLGQALEAAWAESDPARNLYVRRLRKQALDGCWMPPLWTLGVALTASFLGATGGLIFWVIFAGAVATLLLLHLIAALFAIMAAAGDQGRLTWTKVAAWTLVFVAPAALNPVSLWIALRLLHSIGKVRMQKLFWKTIDSRTP